MQYVFMFGYNSGKFQEKDSLLCNTIANSL